MLESPAIAAAQELATALRNYGVFWGDPKARLDLAARFLRSLGGLDELGCLWEAACIRSHQNPSGILAWFLTKNTDATLAQIIQDAKDTRAAGGIPPNPILRQRTEAAAAPITKPKDDSFRWDHVGGDYLERKSADELAERDRALSEYAALHGESSVSRQDSPGSNANGDEGFRSIETRKEILGALKTAKVAAHSLHQSRWVTEFLDAGGTEQDFMRLAKLCENNPGKLVESMRDPHKWRGILADHDLAKKERKLKSRPPKNGEPTRIEDLGPMYGEESAHG